MSESFHSRFRCELAASDGSARLTPLGELDIATAPLLDERLNEALATGSRRLVVDLRELDFMDSTGLRLLARWGLTARQDGFSLSLVRGPERIHRLFELTGMAPHFDFVRA